MQALNGLNDEQNLLTFTTFTKKQAIFILTYFYRERL